MLISEILRLRKLEGENGSEVLIDGELVHHKKLAKEMSRYNHLRFIDKYPDFARYSMALYSDSPQAAIDYLSRCLFKNIEIRSPEPNVSRETNHITMQVVDIDAATTSTVTPPEREPSPVPQQIGDRDLELALEWVNADSATQDHIHTPPLDKSTQHADIDWRASSQRLESSPAQIRECYLPPVISFVKKNQLDLEHRRQEIDFLQCSLEQERVSLSKERERTQKLRQFLNESGVPCVGEARHLGFMCSQVDCREIFWTAIARSLHVGRVHNKHLILGPGLQAPQSEADSNVGKFECGKGGCEWKGKTRSAQRSS
jgi:hypothetical protein